MSNPHTPLSQSEADALLAELKKMIASTITLPDSIDRKSRFAVQATHGDNLYLVQIYRGAKNPQRIQFGAILKKGGVPLLRLCVNAGTHTNPDGTRVSGTHWHRYDETYADRVAYEATDTLGDIINDTLHFLTTFNVTNNPHLAGGLL